MIKKIVICLMCIIIVLGVIGCNKISIKSKDGQLNVGNGKIEYKGDNGEEGEVNISGGKDLEIPENFPKDIVPIIDGAKVKAVVDMSNNEGAGQNVTFSSNESIDKVHKFYEEKLKNSENFVKMQFGEGYSLAGEKDGFGYSVVISKQEKSDETMIMITIGGKSLCR